MAFRLGNTTSNSVLSPTNKALTKIAQDRINSTVARAVARHENALQVDGSDIYLWTKGSGGLICTCRQPQKNLISDSPKSDSIDDLRMPNNGAQDTSISTFRVVHSGAPYEDEQPYPDLPPEFAGLNLETVDTSLDGGYKENYDTLEPLNSEQLDNQLATLLSTGSTVYGGDKTPCGICFTTGKTHGYELATGKRLVLDASFEYPYTLNNSSIKPNTYPYKFQVGSKASVEWTVNLPAYTDGWLNFTIRDNLVPARNLQIVWFYQGMWQPLTLLSLSQTEGSDRSNTLIRVVQLDTAEFMQSEFTHVELIYSTRKPLIGQCPPISYTQNYDVLEPLITTEFEILSSVPEIPRESVFQDSKFKMLWRVLESSPKMTASGQVFSFMVNVRSVHRSDYLYVLKVLFDAQVAYNYRGIEIEQGGLEELETPIYNDDSLTFTLNTFNGNG